MRHNLQALSPLDGRYQADVAALEPFFSEAALFRYRALVEIEYLIFLSRAPSITCAAALDGTQQARLRSLYREFSLDDAMAIAAWDARVNHDVKAVEYWLREQLTTLHMAEYHEMVHFALTSEDVNNIAHTLMMRDARDGVLLPALRAIVEQLQHMVAAEAATPMLARTHGQPATPTTLGKEVAVFVARLQRAIDGIKHVQYTAKLTGASGTLAAHCVAYPDVDWLTCSRAFVRSLALEPTMLTTQIEPHDTLAISFDAIRRTNTILLDMCHDMWRYISDDYLVQPPKEQEVGSSTMPHKVNPIDFENGEGNLSIANALLELFSRKLPISRLQRDLSDSTVLRSVGVAWGHSLLAYRRILKGLQRVAVNHTHMHNELMRHPEVLAEAIQTILRREHYPEPYEVLKRLSRGHALTQDALHHFIDTLDITEPVKHELHQLTPETYIGKATELAQLVLHTTEQIG